MAIYNAEPPITIPIIIHSTTVLCDIAIQWLAGLKVIRWNYCTRGCAQGEATYTMRLLIINTRRMLDIVGERERC